MRTPRRTANSLRRPDRCDLVRRHRIRVAQRTINQHLRQRGLHRAALSGQPRAFGRFEASRPNELWIGDVLVGPFVPYPRTSSSRRSYLFVLLDDYSRLILHARWGADQNTRAGQDVLRAAIQRRGVPERVYFDDGTPYSNAALERTCAVLGIRLIHSRPYARKAAANSSGSTGLSTNGS